MKTITFLFSCFTMMPFAFGGNTLKSSCLAIGKDGSTTLYTSLNDGMIVPLDCPGFVCDDGNYSVTMNYNSSSQKVIVSIENKTTGHISKMSQDKLAVGSALNLQSIDPKSGKFLSLECEVDEILN